MTYGKTRRMIEAEEKIGVPLERALPQMRTELGLVGAADRLGVSKATLGYWLLKLGIEVRTVALGPGDSMEITRKHPPVALR